MADPTSQSNFLKIASEHVTFDWTVDWDRHRLVGSATHDLKVHEAGVQEVIFDTGELDISGAHVNGNGATFFLKKKHEVMGSALHIPLPDGLKVGEVVKVQIFYATTEGCQALQWLSKEQTQGKSFQYLFSQCQPIYARSIAPLQDSPSVKIKYTANVTSVLPVLLSAIRVSPPSDGPPHDGKTIGVDSVTYSYKQPIAIPPYLIAIASGNVRYRPFPQHEDKQWKTGVWAEPELIEAAYWEFSEDTARFLAAEESIVTSYKFGVYDLLVLPPSFPFGGMENACLTFLTPTLLTGDRTLVDVVVHELTHSFFGNGVTAHANHFWLNEGWTTYMERVLQEKLHSPAHRGFHYVIGNKAMYDALHGYQGQPKYQRLVIELDEGEDPDDCYSSIPYEKGANFLLYLERTLGGLDVFLPYAKEYVETFMGKTITTPEWKSHLYEYFRKHGGEEKIKALDSVDWEAWFFGEGVELPVKMEYDLSLAAEAYALAEKWNESRSEQDISKLPFKSDDLKNFDSNQKVAFLERLQTYPHPLPLSHITHLGTIYHFSQTPNAEIRLRFYQLALTPQEAPSPPSPHLLTLAKDTANWLIGADGTDVIKGRMKFCRPLFKAVAGIDRELAREAFGKKKDAFHPLARKMIEKDLGLA